MQRVFLLLGMLLALYVSPSAHATDDALVVDQLMPPENAAAILPAGADVALVDHIALLLPLSSPRFAEAADAVRRGFLAAAGSHIGNALPVRIYASNGTPEDTLRLYRQALAEGARAVAGPLTRNAVTALAEGSPIPVPTLALNTPEHGSADHLFTFGLNAEGEARQAAQQAEDLGLRKAIVISTRSTLSKRLQFAFEEEWLNVGTVSQEIEFDGDPAVFEHLAATPDSVIFLASDARQAQRMRPYLPAKVPIYGTSQLFLGGRNALANFDLDDVRFVDMPWLLQIDHPAVMSYPRAEPPLPVDQERLYALGIDAFRLTHLLLSGHYEKAMPLDGVCGEIQLIGRDFERTAIPAAFSGGQIRRMKGGRLLPAMRLPGEPDLQSTAPSTPPAAQ